MEASSSLLGILRARGWSLINESFGLLSALQKNAMTVSIGCNCAQRDADVGNPKASRWTQKGFTYAAVFTHLIGSIDICRHVPFVTAHKRFSTLIVINYVGSSAIF